jgi:hypothetical protein
MTRVYELPTHLNVEDNLLFGLSARQLLRVAVGASLAYSLWDNSTGLPTGLRIALTAVAAGLSLLVALVEPGGRPLDQWTLAFALFWLLPRRRLWRRAIQTRPDSSDSESWAALPIVAGWLNSAPDVPVHRSSSNEHGGLR